MGVWAEERARDGSAWRKDGSRGGGDGRARVEVWGETTGGSRRRMCSGMCRSPALPRAPACRASQLVMSVRGGVRVRVCVGAVPR